MLPRFPHRSELENAVRGTKLNSSTARQKNMMLSAGVLKVRVFCHPEYIVTDNSVFDLGMFSLAPVVQCISMSLETGLQTS